ncbi:MAG: dTDP-4-dehydrorhamnose reductase [Ferruginibacter sp.]
MTKKTILITGANGQLGSEFGRLQNAYPGFDFLFVTKEELAIDDSEAVKNYFEKHAVDYCINCAAYTAVDKAEAESGLAYRINAEAAGALAGICKTHQSLFIHISTDYVFDGNGTEPYKEDHPVNPMNVYGASKLKGEQLALQNNPGTIIIRTSWVYSSFGNNFVKTMLRLMSERESINVVSDQQGCPTYAADLATAIMQIVTQHAYSKSLGDGLPASNIYHYSNAGITNWFQFALAIKELAGKNCIVNPIETSQYPTPAKRPLYSVMDTSKIKSTFNIAIPFWKDSLEKCIAELSVRS